ncbi:uncharacterized protein LOC128648368 isoform X1 [Bombina bombina]|uniref:uncharacterized protein LOC128648368 isoform X1 n=1 Tax=Bombina bombina TaxID=8345 RepID=UPI00235B2B9F|nr:uncharacterized protein LOC128648368 isoform X1 [Bombina bombina]
MPPHPPRPRVGLPLTSLPVERAYASGDVSGPIQPRGRTAARRGLLAGEHRKRSQARGRLVGRRRGFGDNMQLANVRASRAAVFETDSVTGGRRVQGISRRANVDNIVNENALQRNESLTQNVMVNPMGMNAINPMEMNATETNVQTRINPSGQNTLTKANTLTNAINVQTHNVNQTRNMLTVAADVHTHHVSTSVGTQPSADIIGVSANRMILTEANDYAARPSSVTAAMSRDNTTRDLHVRMAGMNAANDSNIANNINAIHAPVQMVPVQMVPVQMVPADNVSVQGGLSGQNVANAGTAQRVTDAANVAQSGFGAPQVTPGLPLVQGQSARDFLSVLQEVLSVKQNASGMSSTVTASSSAAAASSAAAQQAVPLTTQQAPAQQAPSIVTEGVTSLAPQTTLAAAASAAEAANTSSAGNASGPWLSLIPLVRSSLAPATWRTYVSHWKEWDQFCITRRAESSVSSQGMLGEWLVSMQAQGLRKGAVQSRMAALSFFFKLLGAGDPTGCFFIRQTLKGWGRMQPNKGDVREPITRDRLERLVAVLPIICKSEFEVLLFKAAFVLAFAGALRITELVSPSKKHMDRGVQFDHVRISPPAVLLFIPKSKTDQAAKGTWLTFTAQGDACCPMETLAAYVRHRPALAGQFLIHENGMALSIYQFRRVLALAVERAGFDPSRITPHSFRIGAATDAALQGAQEQTIKTLGRWRSNRYKLYVRPLSGSCASHQV